MNQKQHQMNHKKILNVLIVSMLSIILLVIVFLLMKDSSPVVEPVITHSTDAPDESKPNADSYNWLGAADEPKKIRINKIGVDAFIQKSGVDQDNRIAVPNNVHLASWFADSQKPGQNGLSIIAGHVSGRTTVGVFKQLKDLGQGDEFEIELGNGDIKRYKVLETKQIKEPESAAVLFNQDPNVSSQLNLITCGGNFDSSTDQYEDRIIVSGQLQ